MGTSKALLPHRDPARTLVGYLVRAALTGGATPVLVVGRPGDAELQNEAIAGGGVFVTNDTPDRGQLSSVLAGLAIAAANPAVTGVMVTPVDVPLITPVTIERLIAAARVTAAVILRATFAGRHGHPVLFKRDVFDELRRADPDVGAKSVVRIDPGRVLDIDVDDPGVAIDVDTPEDYERVFGRPVGPVATRRA